MISLFTGAPGTGKTAAMVDLLMSQVGKDRPLFVHGLDGFTAPHVPLTDPTKWMSEVPDGAAVIIDEVQTVWRPRGPGVKVPDHVAALEVHRHRGIDFFITTQGPNLLDSNVRALVGRHVHLRDLGVLGRWWYEWPECADNCRTGFRNAPIKKRYRLPRKIFSVYKSASVHIKPIRSFPMALVVAVCALSVVGFLSWRMYERITSGLASSEPATKTVAASFETVPGATEGTSLPRLSRELEGLNASTPQPSATFAVYPQPRAFAGCVSARTVCRCYDDSGSLAVVPPEVCASHLDRGPVQLGAHVPTPDPSSRDVTVPVVAAAPGSTEDGHVIAWMRAR